MTYDQRRKAQQYADDAEAQDDAYEPCYRDGSLKNECWNNNRAYVRGKKTMMEKKFDLGYGDGMIHVTVKAREIEVLEASTLAPATDLKETFRKAVEEDAIASAPLKEVLTKDDPVTIIISDQTRAWMHQERICPLLLDYLHDVVGIPDEQVLFLIALGTHRDQTEAELRALVTDAVYDRVKVVNHDARHNLAYLGTTTRGTRVEVDPLAVGRKVIMMGGTVHHLLAGYGGGRKSILPGISGIDTIQQNHSLALDPVLPKSSNLVGCGRTHMNPVHEDMMEAAAMVGPVFSINLVVDSNGSLLAMPSGDWQKAWEESCHLVDRYNGVPLKEKADVVLTSCGGFPKDINLYQSSKTLINAYQAVKEGGTLIFISECREGGGPEEFFGWSRYLPSGTLDKELRAHFTIAGYIFYACCEMASHTQMYVMSKLPAETLRDMKIQGVNTVEELQSLLDFGDRHVIVMPHGSSTVPVLQKKE